MPQLRIKGMTTDKIISISKALVDYLETLLKCPREYFVIEQINSTFIADGKLTDGSPIIEIAWFDRGQEIQDKVAEIVTDYVLNTGYKSVDIIFTPLDRSKYYENGEHF